MESSPGTKTITAVTPQKNATDRYSIFLDDEFAFGLGVDVVVEFGLHAGMVLDEASIAEIRDREEIVKATNAGLSLLGYRARSTGELETRLRQKGFSPAAITAAIAKLEGWHYLDDEEFAQSWVEQQQTHRPRSRRALQQELRTKGIDREVIESTLEETEIDEAADALELARKKWASLASQPPEVRQRRLSGFLARRGYGFDIVRKVITTLEEDDSDT
jgi:regulatory protein